MADESTGAQGAEETKGKAAKGAQGAEETPENTGMDAKAMIDRNAKAGTKFRYNDRVKVQIVKATKYYKKGDVIEPHKLMAEQLIAEGTAKEVK